ncbi:hypothetical protein BDBG_16373 [Blastomyces gilchristii SLH14081]|uniref:Uncharacterized protein n=1 Tax=Blastomyces gilchristii (strain SLH14081) TaxID=559298 RepID=A0A179UB83_BLAGS|nr:uncharacterized protein BDBG_16373 [Blastomyces gilchristii SLH14081]OAT04973.1 hypothetical protein BDBG_16373 [Blastomyces gilchristii SLH14081]
MTTMTTNPKPSILYATSQWEKFQQNFTIIPHTSRSKAEFIHALQPGGPYSTINGTLRPAISKPQTDLPLLDKELISPPPHVLRDHRVRQPRLRWH